MNPKYPVYIVSKGRWELRHTSKSLEQMRVPYHIVIEPQEYSEYSQVISPNKILKLPFKNLGQGSIPARNWIWEHSLKRGAKRHWIMDDNIHQFYRGNNSERTRVASGTILKAAEDFTDRYKNIGLSGLNYKMFFVSTCAVTMPAYYLNTRVYSCILINNAIPFRWRGIYNEDTDLSLRALKAGWCTVLFNAFLADKLATLKLKGGNTDSIYKDKIVDRLKMAQSLVEQHPDVVYVTRKYKRWQHHVNYTGFTQQLERKMGIIVPEGVNNYGMILKEDF
jgi:hypothetical protein